MKTCTPHNEAATSVLEMLLFTPLALIFLFAATDLGLALSERAALVDSLIAGLDAEIVQREGASFTKSQVSALNIADDFSLVSSDQEDIKQILDHLAEQIEAAATTKRVLAETVSSGSYVITVAAVIVEIDPLTGELNGYDIFPYVATRPHNGAFNIRTAVPAYPSLTMQEFLERELGDKQAFAPSRFALPVGVHYVLDPTTQASSEVAPRFLERSALLYGEISALTRGINQRYARNVLGSWYAVQEQKLIPFRKLLR